MPKVESAAKAIADLNPDVKVVPHQERLNSGNVDRIFADYEVVVDGTDNFPTRYLVNDASVFLGKPVVHGSIFRFDGQVTTFIPEKAAKKLGVAGEPLLPLPVPGAAAAAPGAELPGGRCPRDSLRHRRARIQATEAIKIVLGKGTTLAGRLLTYDSLKMKFRELKLRRDPNCPVCGPKPTITSYIDYEGFCSVG